MGRIKKDLSLEERTNADKFLERIGEVDTPNVQRIISLVDSHAEEYLFSGELKSFYDKNKSLFKMEAQLKARHILVADKKTAENIIKTLQKSKNIKSKFISLAKEKSTGPSGVNGGDLGWFAPKQMVPEFSNATKKLKIGTITTSPIKTQFGYHVIYLEDKKKASLATFENAKFKISQQLGKERFINQIQTVVDVLKKKAKIEYK